MSLKFQALIEKGPQVQFTPRYGWREANKAEPEERGQNTHTHTPQRHTELTLIAARRHATSDETDMPMCYGHITPTHAPVSTWCVFFYNLYVSPGHHPSMCDGPKAKRITQSENSLVLQAPQRPMWLYIHWPAGLTRVWFIAQRGSIYLTTASVVIQLCLSSLNSSKRLRSISGGKKGDCCLCIFW